MEREAAPMDLSDRIAVDSKILAGKPIVRGTRISVEFVVDLLAAGWSHAQILANYPQLTEGDIRACLAYASSRGIESASRRRLGRFGDCRGTPGLV
jgi:uncharacterized protein (DUF433 family)